MTQKRRVPNVMRSRPKLNMTNIRSDKMSDIKQYYGWSERQLESAVREVAGTQTSRQNIEQVYKDAYGRKE